MSWFSDALDDGATPTILLAVFILSAVIWSVPVAFGNTLLAFVGLCVGHAIRRALNLHDDDT